MNVSTVTWGLASVVYFDLAGGYDEVFSVLWVDILTTIAELTDLLVCASFVLYFGHAEFFAL